MRIRKPLTDEQKKHQSEHNKAWRIANRERLLEFDRQRYPKRRKQVLAQQALRYKENPEKKRAASKKWYWANLERSHTYCKQYRLDHVKECKEYAKKRSPEENRRRATQWAKAHPIEMRLRNAARRARTKGIKIIKEDIHNWESRICGVCDLIIEDKFDVDHIVPLSRGGEHKVENLQLAHEYCNNMKYNKLMEEL